MPSDPLVPPTALTEVANQVEERLRSLLRTEQDRWTALDVDLQPPFAALHDVVLAGGKRLRPAFCYWGFVAAGGDPALRARPDVIDAGAGLELLHCFALVHDDIMDNSSMRRGLPAVHAAFAHRHALSGLPGESRRYGEGVAILVGDLAFVYADVALSGASPEVMQVWNELRLEVNVGQYFDLFHTAKGSPSVDAATKICTYKTAKYTIERPLHLGATLAGDTSQTTLSALSQYGLPLGEAFQLVDDLLGAFGDECLTGKPVGDDFREGKPTRLVAIALERATPQQAAVLSRVGDPNLAEEEIADVQQVITDTRARSEVENTVKSLAGEATRALLSSSLPHQAVTALEKLATYVVDRDR